MDNVFRAVPQFKKIVVEIVDREKLDFDVSANENDEFISDWQPPTKRLAYIAYVKGQGTPVPVEIEVNRITTEYQSEYPSQEQQQEMTLAENWFKVKRANDLYYRDLLTAIVRHLDVEDANCLVADGSARRILELCEWLPKLDVANDEETLSDAEADEDDDKGESVTGA